MDRADPCRAEGIDRISRARASEHWRLAWLIVIGCIPAGVVGVLFEDVIESALRIPAQIAVLLIVFGLVMLAADRLGSRSHHMRELTLADALVVGCAQVLALAPGVSHRHHDDGPGCFAAWIRRRRRGSRSCCPRRSLWQPHCTSCACS